MKFCWVRFGRACFLPLLLVSLSACGTRQSQGATRQVGFSPPSAASGQTYVYECGNTEAVTVRIEGEVAWLFLAAGTFRLPSAVSASGARFSDGVRSYWNKGDQASFDLGEQIYDGCIENRAKSIWEDAKFRGVDFRAVGNEPGWHLEIFDAEKVVFFHNYGQERHEFPASHPVSDEASYITRYNLQNGAHQLLITLEDRRCRDSMSDDIFQTTVRLVFDGKAFSGCGNALH